MQRSGEDEALIGWLSILVHAPGLTDWERKFCASLIARERKSPVRLSQKQRVILSRIVREFKEQELRA